MTTPTFLEIIWHFFFEKYIAKGNARNIYGLKMTHPYPLWKNKSDLVEAEHCDKGFFIFSAIFLIFPHIYINLQERARF